MTTTENSTELQEHAPYGRPKSEFDPCNNAKITSPFYLYKHDSPRPSMDLTKSQSQDPVHVSVHDLEAASFNNLSPSITQEKKEAQNAAPGRNRFMFWKRQKQCLMQPKHRGCAWMARLSPRQRILAKILIALVIIGAAVAIAVSVSIHVGGGVYKTNNTTSQIG